MATTWADLFSAILSLDSYNRGYTPGMTFTGDSSAKGTTIGDAAIQLAANDVDSQAASFYAIAYNWEGEKRFRITSINHVIQSSFAFPDVAG